MTKTERIQNLTAKLTKETTKREAALREGRFQSANILTTRIVRLQMLIDQIERE